MKIINTILCVSALALAATGFAADKPKAKDCNALWLDVEGYMNPSHMDVGFAIAAIGVFESANCLKSSDSDKKHLIAQARAEQMLQEVEELTGVTKDFVPVGRHAHTTSECLLLDYSKEVKSLEEAFDDSANLILFSALNQNDVDGFKSRLTVVKQHVSNILADIRSDRRNICMQPVNEFVRNFDVKNPNASTTPEDLKQVASLVEKAIKEGEARGQATGEALGEARGRAAGEAAGEANAAGRVSTSDQLRINEKIAQLELVKQNVTEVKKKGDQRCIDMGVTSSMVASRADRKCSDVMAIVVLQEYSDQIAILTAELSKKSDLK